MIKNIFRSDNDIQVTILESVVNAEHDTQNFIPKYSGVGKILFAKFKKKFQCSRSDTSATTRARDSFSIKMCGVCLTVVIFKITSHCDFGSLSLKLNFELISFVFKMAPQFKCLNHPKSFCYVCGDYTLVKYRKKITPRVYFLYHKFFQAHLVDQDKSWAPHIISNVCHQNLNRCEAKIMKKMPFAVPMAWHLQKAHPGDCYFCLTQTQTFNQKTKKFIVYPSIDSAKRPMPCSNQTNLVSSLPIVQCIDSNDLAETSFGAESFGEILDDDNFSNYCGGLPPADTRWQHHRAFFVLTGRARAKGNHLISNCQPVCFVQAC